jgi:predicted transporter
MYPNPYFEIFDLEIPANSSVDQVVVDTISIPEPSTLMLAALGLLNLLGFHRRRQRA